MTLRERDIERALVTRIKALGGEVRKVKWIGRKNAPDRVVMARDAYIWRTVWVELKAPGKRPTPAQVREHDRMREVGQCVIVIDSQELIDLHFPR